MIKKSSHVRVLMVLLIAVVMPVSAQIPDYMSDYIDSMCNDLCIDSAMCKAILLKENPKADPKATHSNNNGTVDVGLWQLNDRYMWTTFMGYWVFDEPFNAFDWQDNTYLALKHIKYLTTEFTDFDTIVMSYNCGVKAVRDGKIPDSTMAYLADVKDLYREIKHK